MTLPSSPACPRCGAEMRRRKGSRGEFWGCTKYPDCRGSMDLRPEDQKTPEEEFAERNEAYSNHWRDKFFAERDWWIHRMPSITPAMSPKELKEFQHGKGCCPTCGRNLDPKEKR